jgi:hypothetical protein
MWTTNPWLAFVWIAALGMGGCASNPIVGHGGSQAGQYNGNVGITGNGSTLTIQEGSNVPKLSIVGDGSKVTVEDGAVVQKIEFWGNGNVVTIPDNMSVSIAAMGTNQVVRRPRSGGSSAPPTTGPTP